MLMSQDSKPQFVYALLEPAGAQVPCCRRSAARAGNHVVRVKFKYDGGGIGKGANGTLLVDEKQVAQGRIPQTIAVRFSLDETFDVGEDTGTPVVEDYVDAMPSRSPAR